MRHDVLSWTGSGWLGERPGPEGAGPEGAGPDGAGAEPCAADVVFAFLDPHLARTSDAFEQLRQRYPGARVIGCTTGGEIGGDAAHVGGGQAAALGFDRVDVQVAEAGIEAPDQSHAIGLALGRQLADPELAGVFVVSDGARVNGAALVEGLAEALGPGVAINGGLAGDGDRFGETLVGCDGPLLPGWIVVAGFRGPGLRMRSGHFGGWEPFGPKRAITRSSGTTLHELDGKPALDLYKRYLGDEAENLPGAALLYPLVIHPPGAPDQGVVRTILSIDDAAGTMTFAGDMPTGWTAQLMVGQPRDLIDGARKAGEAASGETARPAFAMLVSCIGRRLLLGQRATEEVQAVVRALGGIAHAGFYSYGEISSGGVGGRCDLHNQTMTVTVFEAA
jgi:hypothetical protein